MYCLYRIEVIMQNKKIISSILFPEIRPSNSIGGDLCGHESYERERERESESVRIK